MYHCFHFHMSLRISFFSWMLRCMHSNNPFTEMLQALCIADDMTEGRGEMIIIITFVIYRYSCSMPQTLTIPVNKVSQSRLSSLPSGQIPFGKYFSDHMFMADFDGRGWSDAQILPYGPVPMSPSISALHYGQAIFEGMKAYKNVNGDLLLFRPHDNFQRMNRSAARMFMPQIPEDLFMEGIMQLVRIDNEWIPTDDGSSLYIRPVLFAMDEVIGVKPSEKYRFVVFTSPTGRYFSEPVRLLVETEYTRAAEGGVGFAKAAGNYGVSMYPTRMAQDKGYHQLIWTDARTHEYIEEAGTMNVFFVFDGFVVTPPAGNTILSGVTRDSVISLLQHEGVKVEQRPLAIREVIDGIISGTLREAFGTGTAATLATIGLIGFQGTDYVVRQPDENALSVRIESLLSAIRRGASEDPFGWTVRFR
jgi:branched-chain amino acid aminotransferase